MGQTASIRLRALAFFMGALLAAITLPLPEARGEFLRSDRYNRERNLQRQQRELNHLRFEKQKAGISERQRQWREKLEREHELTLLERKKTREAQESSRDAQRVKLINRRQETLTRLRDKESKNQSPRWNQ